MVVRGLMLVVAAAALVGGACGGSSDGQGGGSADAIRASSPSRLQVVTTVAPITSIVANIAGGHADVTGVVPEGADSHTFEPAPSVAKVLSRADVIFVNGLKLEDPTRRLAARNLKKGARIVELGNEVLPESDFIYDFSFPKSEGKPNPHLWTDPIYAKKYAEVVKDVLAEVHPGPAASYEANYQAFADQIDRFDTAARTAFATLPADRRELLTYHDAYAYFARTYGWKVVGAIQVESFDEPSAKEVAALIEQVKDEGVPAIFGSEVFPSPVLETIGREAGVEYVDELRDDDLPGEPGEDQHSWLGLMRFNFITMVKALGGDASALEAFEVKNVAVDNAEYPQ